MRTDEDAGTMEQQEEIEPAPAVPQNARLVRAAALGIAALVCIQGMHERSAANLVVGLGLPLILWAISRQRMSLNEDVRTTLFRPADPPMTSAEQAAALIGMGLLAGGWLMHLLQWLWA